MRFVIAVLSLFFLQACTRGTDCINIAQSYLNISFVKLNDSLKVQDTLLPSPMIQTTAYQIRMPKASKTNMLLNSMADSTQLLIVADTNDMDNNSIITLKYKRQAKFISKECGYTYNYILQNATSSNTLVKQIIITDSNITNDNSKKHIQFYF